MTHCRLNKVAQVCFKPGLLYFHMYCYPMSVVGCQLSGVGVDCRFYPSMVVVYCWLSGVGCRLLNIDFRVQLSEVVVCCWLQGVSCRVWLLVVCIGCPAVGINDLCFSFANYFYLFCIIPFLVPLLTEKRGQKKTKNNINKTNSKETNVLAPPPPPLLP
jgi:hypothetical protein